jgi:regulator of sigma E protease
MTGNFLFDLIEFILVFGFLLFAHEFGHYIMARIFGIEVEEFGFGFPPRVKKLFTYKGTDFTLNAIPFGAFVRPKGENNPEVPGGMASANPWKRLGVLVGGPLMNLLVGLIILTVYIANVGTPITSTVVVNEVVANTPAQTAGMQAGDIIQTAQGTKITSIEQLQELTKANQGLEMSVVVLRNNQPVTLKVTPRVDPPQGEGRMGIALGNPYQPISVIKAFPRAAQYTLQICVNTITLPVQLIRGMIPSDQARVVGPVGMFQMFQTVNQIDQQAQSGPVKMPGYLILQFISLISIALGITNLLPIPALDGGRILFVIPELILHKRVPAKYENFVHMVGFTALLLLMAFITVQDVINPIQIK